MISRRARTALALLKLSLPYAAFTVLARFVSIERLVRLAWHAPRTGRDRAFERQLVERVDMLGRLTGAQADCLPRSLLLYRELSKRSADPRLFLGFAGDGRPLVGHAWVVIDGEPLGEADATLSSMTAVCAFGARGEVLALS